MICELVRLVFTCSSSGHFLHLKYDFTCNYIVRVFQQARHFFIRNCTFCSGAPARWGWFCVTLLDWAACSLLPRVEEGYDVVWLNGARSSKRLVSVNVDILSSRNRKNKSHQKIFFEWTRLATGRVGEHFRSLLQRLA